MDILIEQDFFETFMEDYFNQTKSLELETMFTTYTGIKLHTDMSDEYIFSKPILKSLISHNKSLHTKEDFISKSQNNKFRNLSLAFCGFKRLEWVETFEKNGGLYFHKNNYKKKISEILQNHNPIYLNKIEDFKWSDILPFKHLPGKGALIADNYILSDENKMKFNALPIINQIRINQNRLTVLTTTDTSDSYLNFDLKNEQGYKKVTNRVKDEIIQKQHLINKQIEISSDNLNVQVIPFFKKDLKRLHNFDLHDRRLITKYGVITVGKGFDLLPLKNDKELDFKLTIKTFFEKETYDDINNFIPLYNKYVKWYKEKYNQETFLPFE